MEMSVAISPSGDGKTVEQMRSRKASPANSSDLDLWLEKVEAMGELKRITAEVDPDLEQATITYLVGLEKSPRSYLRTSRAIPATRALYNMIGCNLSRFCLMIGEAPVDHPLKAVQALQEKLGRKMPPQEVAAASGDLQSEYRRGATTSTSACFRRSGCGRSTAANISAPATRW